MYNHKYRCVKLDKIRQNLQNEATYNKASEKLAVWNTIDPSTISNIIKWDYSGIIHETLKDIPKTLSWMHAVISPYFKMYMITDSLQKRILNLQEIETIADCKPELLPYLNYQIPCPVNQQQFKILLDMGLNPKFGLMSCITNAHNSTYRQFYHNYLPTIVLYLSYIQQQKQTLNAKESNVFINLIIYHCQQQPRFLEQILEYVLRKVFHPFDDSPHLENRIFDKNTRLFKQLYLRLKARPYFRRIVNERNDTRAIFNPWDSQAEQRLVRYIMIHQSIIPGVNLLPIELLRLIFGHMRHVQL